MKFFNIDLHISVIEDVKNILNTLFPKIEIVDWSISGHSWVMKKQQCDIKFINQKEWKIIDKYYIKNFQDYYDNYLSQFDGFIVTHTPVFALLYEKYDKPIIMVNSCRYEQPYCWVYNKDMLIYLEKKLYEMYNKKQLICISNNLADQKYLKLGTGIESHHIPSLCLYTNAEYKNNNNFYIIKGPRLINNVKNAHYLEDILRCYKWEELYRFKGIIHIPYEISTMSIFEQYSANIPLIFPTKRLLKKLLQTRLIPFNGPYIKNNTQVYKDVIGKMNDSINENWIDYWVDNADFYDENNMKYIVYYDSFRELPEILEKLDTENISKKMKEWNEIRKKHIYNKWNDIMIEYFPLLNTNK
jgi:hypothetical protein